MPLGPQTPVAVISDPIQLSLSHKAEADCFIMKHTNTNCLTKRLTTDSDSNSRLYPVTDTYNQSLSYG